MSKKATESVEEAGQDRRPKSLPIAARRIRTGQDFSEFMSALMTDVIEGNVTPMVANAAVNAGGKLLKSVELQLKYGQPGGNGVGKTLLLCSDGTSVADPDPKIKRRLELLDELARLDSTEEK